MHVALVGLGNIGSHAAEFLARSPGIEALTLIDRDVYDESNRESQAIRRSDAGKPKVKVQAQRLRALLPGAKITGIYGDVEDVPAGRLRADVLAAAVDTRIARQYLGQICWAMGIPWVDSGVNPGSGLVSISTYTPGDGNACIECGWSNRHYETLEIAYPCASVRQVARTHAPASLGGIAGALLAAECGKLLSGCHDQSLAGRQLIYDTRWHKQHLIARRRNPACRFDHRVMPVATALRVFQGASLAEVFSVGHRSGARVTVLGGHGFAMRAFCGGCDQAYHDVWKVARRLSCRRCKRPLTVTGFDLAPELRAGDLPAAVLRRPLYEMGLRPGDVLVLRSDDSEECVRIGDIDD